MTRILNEEMLISRGNVRGRKAMVEILEAGLQAADPYYTTRSMLRLDGDILTVGRRDFEPIGDPQSGDEVIDLSQVDRIYCFGAGKGIQRIVQAIEEVLGDRLTGGHVVAKHGDPLVVERVGVTFGAHPVPDEGCVRGCQRIVEMAHGLTERDLVFTVATNGVSALLTLPAPGISLEDVARTTYALQIEHGVPTADLNPVRNHIDVIKGGRLSAIIQPARAIHIVGWDPHTYDYLMHRNVWLHALPEGSTFADAVRNLEKWDAWDAVPVSVREHLRRADPAHETLKPEVFEKTRFRIFGVLPEHLGRVQAAANKAAELGFTPRIMYDSTNMKAEAGQVGIVMAHIALQIEANRRPFEPPVALIGGTEMVVTVGKESGMGGRNQEFSLAAAMQISGSERIVIASIDTDGTDGPGRQFVTGYDDVPVLNGAIVDGTTVPRAEEMGYDVFGELRRHNTSPILYALGDGLIASPSVSMNDISVALVLE
jgi:glycerate 2-kinase